LAQSEIYILGIESSCDDTSAAVSLNTQILSNVISTQKIHEIYGGVVPELASRAHMQNIVPVINEALNKSGITLAKIDAIAFTRGPGLLGSLLVGTSFAKSLSLALEKPLIDVHHMKAHILAHFIDN
jgi:N6-L-threonylcarbamoyladenine synthase